jgi:uncharacterized protein
LTAESFLAIGLVMAAGAVAGSLGALLGIGGGVFLVPFLNVAMGLPFKVAAAISLVTVIATSSAVSAGTVGRSLINVRLGMLLEVASAAGGQAAGLTLKYLPDRVIFGAFALFTAAIAAVMVGRSGRRNVLHADVHPGVLGGRFFDEDSGREVVYRVKRLPVGMFAAFVAGCVSGSFGIGGGVLKVPILNAFCGVPMRAAAATSALMIGVTAVATVPLHYANGYVHPPLAAAAVLGVLAGSRIGFWQAGRVRAQWLKLLMAGVLAAVSITYLVKAL